MQLLLLNEGKGDHLGFVRTRPTYGRNKNIPIIRTQVKASSQKIRPNGRCIVKRHLFESETEHKEERSKEVLPFREKVDCK
jgi:hypothetical protein